MNYNIEEKLETAVRQIKKWRINSYLDINNVVYCEVHPNFTFEQIENNKLNFKPYKKPYELRKSDSYYVFNCEFDINNCNKHTNAYLHVNMSGTISPNLLRRQGVEFFEGNRTIMDNGEDFLKPQGLLYINDELTQAIDQNHDKVLLNKNGHYKMTLLLYVDNITQPCSIKFNLIYEDKRVNQAYYDYLCAWETISLLKQNCKEYKQAIKDINKAINIIDFRNRDKKFIVSLKKSSNILKEKFYIKHGGNQKYQINCIGHSHIDMAWLWDIHQTRLKSQRTFSTVLKLMDEYPEYKFIHTSPQLFEFLKQDNPKLFERIKEKVKEGRFEIEGASWVEPDCNLTSGESLVRQILYGKSFIKEEFGIDSKILFLPDVFGYAFQIPQILKKSGISKFSTTKIGWNDTNRFPMDTFMWKGMDGTKIFTYLISTCTANPRNGIKDTNATSYNGHINANELLGTWNRYQSKDYNNVVFTTYGYGDGGGGPTRAMLEKQQRFTYGPLCLGKTKTESLTNTLNTIENNFKKSCKKTGKTPTWNNELYLEYHRGTYTSVPYIKKKNRENEFLLLNTELLATLAKIYKNTKYPKQQIDTCYKKMMLNQFHDILPGSSIKKVYDDAKTSIDEIENTANKIIKNNAKALFEDWPSKYVVFNPNSFSYNMPITINKKCHVIDNVPAYGAKTVDVEFSENLIKIKKLYLENEFFKINFNKKGEITSLIDKAINKEFVANKNSINKFVVYEDIPYQWDNWEISPYYKQKKYTLDNKASFETIDEGDRKGFLIIRKYYKSVIKQYVYLYNGIARIDFYNDIDWNEKNQLLKIHFPVNIKCKQARFDVQFGSIARNTVPQNSYDEAKFEVCGQKWVDLSNGEYGLAVLNDGKYGFGVYKNDLSMTILKSGAYPYSEASDYIPPFTFSLLSHLGDFKNSEIVKHAYAINRPALLIENSKATKYEKKEISYFDFNAKGVVLETVKKGHFDNSTILRGFEHAGQKSNVSLKIKFPFKKAYICDLMENKLKELTIKNNTLKFKVKPFEIFTIKIK